MLVAFAANARNLKQDLPTYKLILDTVYKNGHNIVNDWVATSEVRLNLDLPAETQLEWQTLAKGSHAAIEIAEVMIVEASGRSSFGVGFEAALALQLKKPCLFLISQQEAGTSYSIGIEHTLLTKKEYTTRTLPKIVEEFLKDNTIKTKDLRFNFVIDRQIHNHLRWRSFKTGKTKSEILRDLVLRDIKDSDD